MDASLDADIYLQLNQKNDSLGLVIIKFNFYWSFL